MRSRSSFVSLGARSSVRESERPADRPPDRRGQTAAAPSSRIESFSRTAETRKAAGQRFVSALVFSRLVGARQKRRRSARSAAGCLFRCRRRYLSAMAVYKRPRADWAVSAPLSRKQTADGSSDGRSLSGRSRDELPPPPPRSPGQGHLNVLSHG